MPQDGAVLECRPGIPDRGLSRGNAHQWHAFRFGSNRVLEPAAWYSAFSNAFSLNRPIDLLKITGE
jgi:hypothetical protein